MSRSERDAPVYALTIRGALGPVLRTELGRLADVVSEPRTILRLSTSGAVDLVGLLIALESHGVDVVDVRAVA